MSKPIERKPASTPIPPIGQPEKHSPNKSAPGAQPGTPTNPAKYPSTVVPDKGEPKPPQGDVKPSQGSTKPHNSPVGRGSGKP